MRPAETARNVGFVVLGVALLVLKPQYAGPGEEFVYSYLGNASVSFALYFVTLTAIRRRDVSNLALASAFAAGMTLVAVEFFEIADGFGAMENTYDTVDLLANAVGVGLAVVADWATRGFGASDDESVNAS